MAYYKGKFIYTKDLKYKNFECCIAKTKYMYSFSGLEDIEFFDIGYDIKKLSRKDIYNASRIKDYKFRQEVLDSFNDYFASKILNIYYEIISTIDFDIVYEIVKDKSGNLYGKELYTGLLFPILLKSNYFIDYEIIKREDTDRKFYLKGTAKVNFDSLYKCDIFITGNQVANQNEVDEYQNKFNKGFRKEKKKKEHIYFIKYLYNKNVFKEDFTLVDDKKEIKVKELEKENIETSLMEEIEYNLINLKSIDNNLYNEYRSKYEKLLNSFINKENLALLLGEIEFSLIFRKQSVDNILEIIRDLKHEYLDNFINKENKKTDLNLKKLDKINELFLKVKDKYDYKSQRDVLNNLSFLYLMEVIENIDTLDINDLNNSYFKTHLKSIIIWIKLLIDYDIIKCSYIISLRDEINIDIVIDIIKNIKFNNNDDKIKKIGEIKWI